MILVLEIFIAGLLFYGLFIALNACINQKFYSLGNKKISKMSKQKKHNSFNFWNVSMVRDILKGLEEIVYLDEVSFLDLEYKLKKADIMQTPRQWQAKQYLIIFGGLLCSGLFVVIHFWFGVLLAVLITIYCIMRQREKIAEKIKAKDLDIAQEMPRFVRTIARHILSDRDLFRVLESYRKVAGDGLGAELDILLAEMRTGNTQLALSHFQRRIGTAEAFHLCSALQNMMMGTDQTATLEYLANRMSTQVKENLKKEISVRPAKMRSTFYPAVVICIMILMYVMVVYVVNSLNGLF